MSGCVEILIWLMVYRCASWPLEDLVLKWSVIVFLIWPFDNQPEGEQISQYRHEELWFMGLLRHMVQCFCEVLSWCKYTKTGSGNGSNDSNEKWTRWRCMYFLLTMRPLRPMNFCSFLLQNEMNMNEFPEIPIVCLATGMNQLTDLW